MTAIMDRPARRRDKGAPKPLDPVTQYAVDVREGRIIAGRAVRQACLRHERNLEHQRTADFPYYFDVAAAQHIIDFFPQFLTLENGAPFRLPLWLQFSYGSIYGWKCWDGRDDRGRVVVELDPEHLKRVDARRFIHGFFETSKGSGKTPSAGGIGLYGAAYDDEAHAEIYSTGFDRGQASIILNDAIRMGQYQPHTSDPRHDAIMEFRAEFRIDKYNIAHPESGSFFRAMSSQHQSKSGPRPHYVLSDEIHEQRDGTVVSKAESGFKNRRQPLGLKYTNSGSDRTSYCWELHQRSLAVLDGSVVDEQWFAYICHLDPCEACYQEGYRQPKDGCAECDDWMNPAVWPKIAPALGVVIQPKYLRDALETALAIPSQYALKRRLNFCIWTETHQTWISSDRWDACKVPVVHDSNPEMLPCAIGLDPASTMDLASAVVALRIEDPPNAEAETVEIEGMDEFGEQVKLAYLMNFTIELIPFFWIPRDTLIERVRTERIPMDVWARDGFLFTTPGPSIDHDAIYNFVIRDLWKRFRAQRLGMDENGGRYLYMKFKNEGRLDEKRQLVSVGQGKKLSEAYKFMEILIAKRRLRHNGNPVLAWNIANAEPQVIERTNTIWIEKPSESKRIDGAVAAAMAIKELMALPAKRKRSIGVFIA